MIRFLSPVSALRYLSYVMTTTESIDGLSPLLLRRNFRASLYGRKSFPILG